MREIKFRVWHRKEKKIYFRGYQKLLHVLLCEDDQGKNQGKGIPIKRANYEDCEFLETTSLEDKNGKEIFEGDRIRVKTKKKTFEGIVPPVPDMFRSRKIHPLANLLEDKGVSEDEILELEVIGSAYESRK